MWPVGGRLCSAPTPHPPGSDCEHAPRWAVSRHLGGRVRLWLRMCGEGRGTGRVVSRGAGAGVAGAACWRRVGPASGQRRVCGPLRTPGVAGWGWDPPEGPRGSGVCGSADWATATSPRPAQRRAPPASARVVLQAPQGPGPPAPGAAPGPRAVRLRRLHPPRRCPGPAGRGRSLALPGAAGGARPTVPAAAGPPLPAACSGGRSPLFSAAVLQPGPRPAGQQPDPERGARHRGRHHAAGEQLAAAGRH